MENKIKVEYLFAVRLGQLNPIDRKIAVKNIKKRLNLSNQSYSRRMTEKIKDVWGHELRVWSEELKCSVDELYKKEVQNK